MEVLMSKIADREVDFLLGFMDSMGFQVRNKALYWEEKYIDLFRLLRMLSEHLSEHTHNSTDETKASRLHSYVSGIVDTKDRCDFYRMLVSRFDSLVLAKAAS